MSGGVEYTGLERGSWESVGVLDAVEEAFKALVAGVDEMRVHGEEIDLVAVPQRLMRLDELSRFLLLRSTPLEVRDAAWRLIVGRARESAGWALAAAGMEMPALRNLVRIHARPEVPDAGPEDVGQAALEGFYRGLREVDLRKSSIAARLRRFARDAALVLWRDSGVVVLDPQVFRDHPMAPLLPWQHPDMVLIDAIAKDVLTENEAELIGRTRLENVAVVRLADEWRESQFALYHRRARAEARLVRAIRIGKVRAAVTPPAA
jgi:hypothetical protein